MIKASLKVIMLIVSAIFILILLAYFGYTLFYKNDPTPITHKNTEIEITQTSSAGEKQELIGLLKITNNHLVYDETKESNVGDYIKSNIKRWETTSLEYPTGGMTEDGSLWDGVAKTNISKEDFLNAVWSELYDEWDGFDIDLR